MKRYIAEFLGTLLIVVLAAGALVADVFFGRAHLTDSSGAVTVALAYGLTTLVVLATLGRVSGGYANPAVAIGLMLIGRLKGKETAGLVGMQLLGAIGGGFVVKAIAPPDAFAFTAGGAPSLADGVSMAQGMAIEMIGTFLVALSICGTFMTRGPRSLGPVAAGVAVTAGVIATGPFTGGGLNPARWLGPALASNHLANWGVWLVGPLLGAMLGALIYENVLAEPEAEPEAEPGSDEAAAEAPAGEAKDEAGRALPAGSAPAEPIVPGKAPAAAGRKDEPPSP